MNKNSFKKELIEEIKKEEKKLEEDIIYNDVVNNGDAVINNITNIEEFVDKELIKLESKLENKTIKNASIKFYDNSDNKENSAIVEYYINNPDKYDRIGLYHYDNMHDSDYIHIINVFEHQIKKDNTNSIYGKYTFNSLVNGYYEVRLLNLNKRYENVEPAICCVGPEVKFYVDIINDKLNIYIPSENILNSHDYIAVFNKNENSNNKIKSVFHQHMYNAEDVNFEENKDLLIELVGKDNIYYMTNFLTVNTETLFKKVSFNLHNISGEFIIKYFYHTSTSILKGNIFSGYYLITINK